MFFNLDIQLDFHLFPHSPPSVYVSARTHAKEMSRGTTQQDLFDSTQQRPTAMLYINWCFWALNLGKYIQGPAFLTLCNSNRGWISISSRLFHHFALSLLHASLFFPQNRYTSASPINYQHAAARLCLPRSLLSSLIHQRGKRDSRSQSLLCPLTLPTAPHQVPANQSFLFVFSAWLTPPGQWIHYAVNYLKEQNEW